MAQSDSQYHLSPNQQDLLVAALASNQPPSLNKASTKGGVLKVSRAEKDNQLSAEQDEYQSSAHDYFEQSAPATFPEPDDSPYLGLDLDVDGDDHFDLDNNGQLIDSFPGDASQVDNKDLHEKRKSVGDKDDDDDDGGGKRRESEGGTSKKPGRKPLTAEPTTKRKAQNRAAQRAFRERKERHLKDLETKVEDLEKASKNTSHENGLLRAQVERLQIELKEYRKRLSWVSNGGQGASPSLGSGVTGAAASKSLNSNHNDFQFEFPRFGDLPANSLFNSSGSSNKPVSHPTRSSTLPPKPSNFSAARHSFTNPSPKAIAPRNGSTGNSPINASSASPPNPHTHTFPKSDSFDSFSGLFSPSILEASRQASSGYFPQNANVSNPASGKIPDHHISPNARQSSTSALSNTESPASSYESQQNGSSIATSPEPSLSSPGQKTTDYGLNTINEEYQPHKIFRVSGTTPAFDPNSFNWFANQNGGGFDPVLFGDYREPQDAVVSQDFGAFFNEAFPLPELGSPEHNFNEVPSILPKPDLMAQVEAVQDGKEEHVPTEDHSKMMTCNSIWDRLQSMDKFRNGEIDIDNLCSDLRSKARCSEGRAVVPLEDVDTILGPPR